MEKPKKLMFNKAVTASPFVKWVGGKRQLLDDLIHRLPKTFTNYFEPFIGGGALFWHLHDAEVAKIHRPCIGDFNEELINAYRVIKEEPLALIACLGQFVNTKEFYYEVRAWDRCASYMQRPAVQRAARFIYLNKTGFNGLYRVNKNNQHNVPFGRYKNPKILDQENILACSAILQYTDIYQGDFESILSRVARGDFVYLDPPYIPLNATSNFTNYTSGGFDMGMQQRLKEFCDTLTERGVKFMLSNSSAPLVYELYSNYHIDKVFAGRTINANATGRGKVVELIVRNYTSA